jgi:hypothetical protein
MYIMYWAFLIILLPISIGFYWFHFLSKGLKLLCLFLCFILFFELLNRILIYYGFRNLLSIWHIYTFIEFCFLGLIFQKHIIPPLRKSWFAVIFYGFIILALLNTLFLQGFTQFNSYNRVLESLIFIVFSIVALFRFILEEEKVSMYHFPIFWFASGVLLYFSGNLFIYIFSNFLMKNYTSLNKYTWLINALMNDILYMFFSVALWKGREEKVRM